MINIVMLAKDRPRLTRQCLETLFKNTPGDKFNLTLVDDESLGGNCYYMFLEFQRDHKNMVWIRINRSKLTTGFARNLAVYAAEGYFGRGDWLYLTDNDMYFTPGWSDALVVGLETAAKIKLIGGWNHPFLHPKEEERTAQFGVLTGGTYTKGQVLPVTTVKSHDAVAGASQLMRWPIWDRFGPLDAHAQGVGQSEDWAFCQKIIQDGFRVGSVYPRVVFNCGVTNSYGKPSPGTDEMVKELREAQKQYPDLVWE